MFAMPTGEGHPAKKTFLVAAEGKAHPCFRSRETSGMPRASATCTEALRFHRWPEQCGRCHAGLARSQAVGSEDNGTSHKPSG